MDVATTQNRIFEAALQEFATFGIAGARVERIAEATKLDAADLPEHAGRLFDDYEDHPESQRLLSWGQLESDEKAPASVHWQSMVAEKTARIANALAQGLVDPSWSPLELLYLICQLAATWTGKAPDSDRRPSSRGPTGGEWRDLHRSWRILHRISDSTSPRLTV